jgi:hypothetical protein
MVVEREAAASDLDLLLLGASSRRERGLVLHGALGARMGVNVDAAKVLERRVALVRGRGLGGVLAEVSDLLDGAVGRLLTGSVLGRASHTQSVVAAVVLIPAVVKEVLVARRRVGSRGRRAELQQKSRSRVSAKTCTKHMSAKQHVCGEWHPTMA